jgi:invasion protein IalB
VPETTTASFGDWVLRCARAGEGAQAQRVCEVGQSLQVQGQQGFVAQIAVGRTARNEPLRMTVLLPTNVSFPSSVRISGDENDTSPVDLPWRRCIPGACIADNAIADPALQRLRARTTAGRITFKDALGRDVTLPISLRGLAQGLDALAREQ